MNQIFESINQLDRSNSNETIIHESITQMDHSNSSEPIIHDSWIRSLNQLTNWIIKIPMKRLRLRM